MCTWIRTYTVTKPLLLELSSRKIKSKEIALASHKVVWISAVSSLYPEWGASLNFSRLLPLPRVGRGWETSSVTKDTGKSMNQNGPRPPEKPEILLEPFRYLNFGLKVYKIDNIWYFSFRICKKVTFAVLLNLEAVPRSSRSSRGTWHSHKSRFHVFAPKNRSKDTTWIQLETRNNDWKIL